MLALEPKKVKTVTAMLLGRIGDLVVGTPFLRALRRRYPAAKIRLVITRQCRELAGLIPFQDEVVTFHRLENPLANIGSAARLLARRSDLFVDLNPSFSRRAIAVMSLSRSPIKLGFRKGRRDSAFTDLVDEPSEDEHMLDRYARLASALDAPMDPKLELRTFVEQDMEADKILARIFAKSKGPRVLIHAGNFKKYENRWPEERFARLTDQLTQDENLSVCYLTGPGEERPTGALVARLKNPVPVIDPQPMGIMAALLKKMDLCVLNITGTTHMAAALGTPTFGFYSGYTHAVWRLRGPEHTGVVCRKWESCRETTVEEAWKALRPVLDGLIKAPKKA